MTLSEALDIARKAKPQPHVPEQREALDKSRASSHEAISIKAAALNKRFDGLSAKADGMQKQLGEIRRGIAIVQAHFRRTTDQLQ